MADRGGKSIFVVVLLVTLRESSQTQGATLISEETVSMAGPPSVPSRVLEPLRSTEASCASALEIRTRPSPDLSWNYQERILTRSAHQNRHRHTHP